MQVGDADLVVLVVVEEEQLIQRLGHVINAARAGRVQISSKRLSGWGINLEVSLRDGGAAVGAIAVDAHGAQMHHMDVETALHDGGQQVVGAVDVVVDRVALGGAFHRIGAARCSAK